MKKKLKINREIIRKLDIPTGGICTNLCTYGIDCGNPSGVVECLPNYTCGYRCIPY